MNVLVYSGPEVIPASLEHTLSSIRLILTPHYTVQTISQQSLALDPWSASCALLVCPCCHELSQSRIIAIIRSYVENGGAFLAFSASASYSSSRIVDLKELNISGLSKDQTLLFYDEVTASYLYPKFRPRGEVTVSLVTIQLVSGETIENVEQSWSGEFAGFESAKNVKILARIGQKVAAVHCTLGQGAAVVWAPGIEFSLAADPADLAATSSEKKRQNVIRETLRDLGLHTPSKAADTISHPLPQFMAAHPSRPQIMSLFVTALSESSLAPGKSLTTFKDKNDTFLFHDIFESERVLQEAFSLSKNYQPDASIWQPKHIILCRDGEQPSPQHTPLFDIGAYFIELSAARETNKLSHDVNPWGMGEALIYGEVVTSTQTMLDKNPRLMSLLPTPLLSIASYQLAGRGRGGNVWLSPSGCLLFSLLLRTSLATLPATKLVFVQYLFALAVVEACREDSVLGKLGEKVRLKWPNDLYAVIGPEVGDRKKIGGILVSTNFTGNQVEIVIGCGLDVLSLPPITSLVQLLPSSVEHNLSVERTAAAIMAKFEGMWSTFVSHRGSFDPFIDLYLERWLHSDQLVTLTTITPHKVVRITGITPDHGLLRTIPERTGWTLGHEGFIDLRPDGNSFDIMAGLIKSKH